MANAINLLMGELFLAGMLAGGTPPVVMTTAAAEGTAVLSAVLSIRTCDKKDTKTDDAVYAELRDGARTWLDYGRNDFERNATYDYDLDLTGISTVADITRLRIHKNGSNGLCISRVRLYINQVLAFERSYASGRWLDNSDADRTLEFSSAALRADAHWSAVNLNLAKTAEVTRAEFESLIESLVGTAIHGNALYWGHYHGRAVEVSRKSDHVLLVDLDLGLDLNNWFDPEVDINFEVHLCKDGAFAPSVKNRKVNVDSRWYSEVVSLGIAQLVDDKAHDRIARRMKGLDVGVGPGLPLSCPTIRPDVSIRF